MHSWERVSEIRPIKGIHLYTLLLVKLSRTYIDTMILHDTLHRSCVLIQAVPSSTHTHVHMYMFS
jgi:hypothetical protein